MSDFNAIPLQENPEPRCPVVLLLDRSGSMQGEPINQLNEALIAFRDEIQKDTLASLRVEIAVITFGGIVQVYDSKTGMPLPDTNVSGQSAFTSAIDFHPPQLTPDGQTPMGSAVEMGIRLIRERKDYLKQNGHHYYRPWILLITDGNPTDDGVWQRAAELSKQEESRKGVYFYGVGVENADMTKLSKFSDITPPLKLKGLAFRELFVWLSNSLSGATQQKPGEGQVSLPSVTPWAQIDTSSN